MSFKKSLMILSIITLFLVSGCVRIEPEPEDLTGEDLIKIALPSIEKYCQDLNEQVTHSACPTCRWTEQEKFVEVSDFSLLEPNEYNEFAFLKKDNDNDSMFSIENSKYILRINLLVIYGRNTRTGTSELRFVIDNKGNILEKDLEEMTCY